MFPPSPTATGMAALTWCPPSVTCSAGPRTCVTNVWNRCWWFMKKRYPPSLARTRTRHRESQWAADQLPPICGRAQPPQPAQAVRICCREPGRSPASGTAGCSTSGSPGQPWSPASTWSSAALGSNISIAHGSGGRGWRAARRGGRLCAGRVLRPGRPDFTSSARLGYAATINPVRRFGVGCGRPGGWSSRFGRS